MLGINPTAGASKLVGQRRGRSTPAVLIPSYGCRCINDEWTAWSSMPYFTGGSTLGIPGGHPPKLVQMYQPLGDGLVMVSPKIIPCLIVPQCWPNPVLFSLDIPGHPWTQPSLQWLLHRFNLQLASQPWDKCQHGQSPAKRRVKSGDLRREMAGGQS